MVWGMPPGTLYLSSPHLPDVRHGFTTRHGGTSTGLYASLNLGEKWGDAPERVGENYTRLAADARFDLGKFFAVEQVHGREVITLAGDEAPAIVRSRAADAIVTKAKGLTLAVRVADCVPILLTDEDGRVGVVHAGWRGTAAGIVTAALDAMFGLGAKPENVRAAIGPCICGRCYEVGDEVAQKFAQVAPAALVKEPGKKSRLDLAAANHLQLLESGVSPDNVWRSGRCTMHEAADFYSYRRDGAQTGQHIAFICSSLR